MWTPINKKTKHRYPPITDAEKAKWLEDKHIRERYVFEQTKEAIPTAEPPKPKEALAIPEPIEAKRIEEEPEEVKEKKTKTAKTKE